MNENNSIEFVKVIIGLRDEYIRNQKRLQELKQLVSIDPEKYSDFYFYVKREGERLRLCIELLNKKTKKSFKDLFTKRKTENSGAISFDDNGISINNTGAIVVNDKAAFASLSDELLHDQYLNSNFNTASIIGDNYMFRISPYIINLEKTDNDPNITKYIGENDTIQCVFYDRKYRIGRKWAEDILHMPIPRECISSYKQSIIDSNPNTKKEIEFAGPDYFDLTQPDLLSRLNLMINTDGEKVILRKI